MTLTLGRGEPLAGPWRVAPLAELVDLVVGTAGDPVGRPRIVAVDGRGAGGKSTIAQRVAAAVLAAAVLHTDDIAFGHSFFDWADLIADGVLSPLRSGASVRYRPPGWDAAGRDGAIELPAGLRLVLVEGVGAARRELTPLLDAVIWVQSDFAEAERRGIARDIESGVNGDVEQTIRFWHQWMDEELPFQANQQPWLRADVIVAGTPMTPLGPEEVMLAPPLVQGPSR